MAKPRGRVLHAPETLDGERASEDTIRPLNTNKPRNDQKFEPYDVSSDDQSSTVTVLRQEVEHEIFDILNVPHFLRFNENEEPLEDENALGMSSRLEILAADPWGPGSSKKEGEMPIRQHQNLSLEDPRPLFSRDSLDQLANVADCPVSSFDGTTERVLRPKASTLSHNYDYIDAQRVRQSVQQPPDPVSRWSSSTDNHGEKYTWAERLSKAFRNLNKRKVSTTKLVRRGSVRARRALSKEKRVSWGLTFGNDGPLSTPRRAFSWRCSSAKKEVASPPTPCTPSSTPTRRFSWRSTSRRVTPTRLQISSPVLLSSPNSAGSPMSPRTPPPGRPAISSRVLLSSPHSSVATPRVRTPVSRPPAMEIAPVRQRQRVDADTQYFARRLQAANVFRDEDGGLLSPREGSEAVDEGVSWGSRLPTRRADDRDNGSGWF